jgi:hypothetical protein
VNNSVGCPSWEEEVAILLMEPKFNIIISSYLKDEVVGK